MDPRPDAHRRWFAHEKAAHELVLASLETVPEGRRDADHAAAVDLVLHLAAARRLWLHRLGATEVGPAALFPRGGSVAGARAELAAVQVEWDAYLGRLDAAELDRVVTYGALEGGRFRSRVEDLLTQLQGHSWYHRGQVALLVRRLGGRPAVTDFVLATRERVDA